MKGFIFNHDKCVGCKACSAACALENNWSVNARIIYTQNGEAFLPEPVINLSMACNHCEEPLCLYGCPVTAFYRDPESPAILTDQKKCIGCKYCIWNCPYDAPKLDPAKGYVEKCHLCYHRLHEEMEPACTSACPTGALSFGDIPGQGRLHDIKWIPDRKLNPSLLLTGNRYNKALKIIPDSPAIEGITDNSKLPGSISKEWSLIGFSFLVSVSAGISVSGLAQSYTNATFINILLMLLAGIFAVFHLRTPLKAWRSVNNIMHSPLSREITLFIVYALFLVTSLLFNNPVLRVLTPLSALLLLLAIDNVYTYSDRSLLMSFHSGQTFLTGLLIASFLMKVLFPFIFIAAVKLSLIVIQLYRARRENLFFGVRFLRMAMLIISVILIVIGVEKSLIAGYAVFMAGELLDRIIYYIDFEPINIANSFNRTIIPLTDEKERN